MRRVIGLAGLAGSGKDTARAYLESRGFVGLAFADPIRDMLGALLDSIGEPRRGMTDRDLKELPIASLGLSYRQLAQALGTEWGRGLRPSLWVDLAAVKLAATRRDVVISDVRFPDEVDWVRSQGGEVWRLVRPEAPAVRPHVSECEELACDLTVRNDSDLRTLYRRLEAGLG